MPNLNQITVELTNACNTTCHFCLNKHREKPLKHMDLSVLQEVIHQYKALDPKIPLGICGIGEPLMHPHFDEALALLRGVKFGIGTNCALLDRKGAAIIKSQPAQIVMSIDAHDQKAMDAMRPKLVYRNVRDNALDFISMLQTEIPWWEDVYVQMIVTEANKHQVNEYAEYWLDKLSGIPSAQVFIKQLCPSPDNRTRSMYPSPKVEVDVKNDRLVVCDWEKPISFSDCSLFSGFIQVQSDGAIVPCCLTPDDHWNLGNIKDTTLWTVFHEGMEPLRGKLRKDIPFCKDCI